MARAYDNTGRAERALVTRGQILDTALGLLLDGGYAAMTVASLAAAAGVSPQTVYNSVGGKPAVVKAVYDRLLAGDEAEVAMSDRPEFQALFAATDRSAFVAAYAAWVRVVLERVAPLLGALLAHGADASLADFVATIERERYTGTTQAMTGLRTRLGLPEHVVGERGFARLVDAVWALNAPDAYDRLVRRSGWTSSEYEAWLTGQLTVLLT
ncbi:TetR/AcrR family transcriptional regulator [Nocardioides jiangxiensis]|uniref:TetR/AcrR family transcriptional regulator n=1 Tax=Nocardioides jiangxiensis TaxID=3064524 RepID=A0ABT9AXF1_9ACTN|nr:TetR/AcrR family transcriptional regulator [Nocardioides sp. WY-20]MDO7867221.1 TetR/AcrR family transcriptional regulator [Nocardioides sp. WY-20]